MPARREEMVADRVRNLNAFLIGGNSGKTWETRKKGKKDERQKDDK